MINENYLNFYFTSKTNKEEIKRYLSKLGFKKVGHKKTDCCGFCIRLRDKSFFECSNFNNPQIEVIISIDQIKTKIQNYENAKQRRRKS